ncbi:MAG: hypothetical protein J0L70_27720 [Leptolyngbya sp. UWPOB_LEPTO1]|uniref:DUF5655 domain-containing protein n=1 Tax=Leptolyngbya sp. UWPOB_LEPTO1 TaxID=2815653 RepID=UPI001AC6FD64|nr:DUF5655 domain-containing protein [Leptolyngbya sp. UWPOB_LEPTO1]MBN8564327.1 hypothetical protein [Leptolyngbya sp. UWPOB_LEPTO1]
MSDIKLFRISGDTVTQLEAKSATLERHVQNQIEKHLKELLGIQFLETEYSTGPRHGGRIDTLGIDENGCPAIVEYKRSLNENVINQGLYYLDWLLDHQGEFKLLVLDKFGKDLADKIDWSNPRLLCIAGDFTKYDTYAVEQINRNIELIRYSYYGDDLLMLDLVKATSRSNSSNALSQATSTSTHTQRTVADAISQADDQLKSLYQAFHDFATSLSDDVTVNMLKLYVAFKRLKNFACVSVQTNTRCLMVWLKLDPDTVELEDGFSRDVRNIGHWGTGDLELMIKTPDDLEKAKPLIIKSYEGS